MKSKAQNEKAEVGTLVCFALNEEAAPFRKLALRIPDLAILITGIGRPGPLLAGPALVAAANQEAQSEELLDHKPLLRRAAKRLSEPTGPCPVGLVDHEQKWPGQAQLKQMRGAELLDVCLVGLGKDAGIKDSEI